MKLRPSVFEFVVSDMAVTLAFYRRLGLDIPPEADDQPHAEAELGGGLRLPGTPRTPSVPSTRAGAR